MLFIIIHHNLQNTKIFLFKLTSKFRKDNSSTFILYFIKQTYNSIELYEFER